MSQFIEAKIIGVLRKAKAAKLCRRNGISETTYYTPAGRAVRSPRCCNYAPAAARESAPSA